NDSGYKVECDVKPNDIRDWLPGKKKRKKLERILNMCMPGNLEYSIKIRVKQEPSVLGTTSKTAYLGFGTYLSSHNLRTGSQQA
ncbi:MAG: hypothetical protein DRP47_09910, partial [Candidatus Zixiibacteriota bacterium]